MILYSKNHKSYHKKKHKKSTNHATKKSTKKSQIISQKKAQKSTNHTSKRAQKTTSHTTKKTEKQHKSYHKKSTKKTTSHTTKKAPKNTNQTTKKHTKSTKKPQVIPQKKHKKHKSDHKKSTKHPLSCGVFFALFCAFFVFHFPFKNSGPPVFFCFKGQPAPPRAWNTGAAHSSGGLPASASPSTRPARAQLCPAHFVWQQNPQAFLTGSILSIISSLLALR